MLQAAVNKEEKGLALAIAFLLVAQFALVGLERHWQVSEASGGAEAGIEIGPGGPVWCEQVDGQQVCFDWDRLI